MALFCFSEIVQGKRNSLQKWKLLRRFYQNYILYKILSVAGVALEWKQKYSKAEKGTEWMLTMKHTAQFYSHNSKGKSHCHLLYIIIITITIITIPGEQQK